MKPYEHFFFDLDHTLWDFDRNAAECLTELLEESPEISEQLADKQQFIAVFEVVNRQFWQRLEAKEITHQAMRKYRFQTVLARLGVAISAEKSEELNDIFLAKLPHKTHLLPHALPLVQHLAQHGQLHIISNGFQEVQRLKMQRSGLWPFFNCLITNDVAKASKPDLQIFQCALNEAQATTANAIMIGDTYEADILGAVAAQLAAVHYNPMGVKTCGKATHEITCLQQLPPLLGLPALVV